MQMCAICHGDPNEPVCLDCEHILCRSCLQKWLDTRKRTCPYCIQPLPENFNMVVSKEIRYGIVLVLTVSPALAF